jgi:hypothetical protein
MILGARKQKNGVRVKKNARHLFSTGEVQRAVL